jgi:hypothetical protein
MSSAISFMILNNRKASAISYRRALTNDWGAKRTLLSGFPADFLQRGLCHAQGEADVS